MTPGGVHQALWQPAGVCRVARRAAALRISWYATQKNDLAGFMISVNKRVTIVCSITGIK